MEKAIITGAIIIASSIVAVAIIKSESKDDSWIEKSDKDSEARRIMQEALYAARRINE